MVTAPRALNLTVVLPPQKRLIGSLRRQGVTVFCRGKLPTVPHLDRIAELSNVEPHSAEPRTELGRNRRAALPKGDIPSSIGLVLWTDVDKTRLGDSPIDDSI